MRVRRFALSGPDSLAIIRLLDYFKRGYARSPVVREHAVSLLSQNCVGNNDKKGQVAVLAQHVKDKLTYVSDPAGSEYVVSPLRLIAQIKETGSAYGDCDDHALLLNSLLSSVGIQTRFLGVKLNGSTKYNHVICSAMTGTEWQDIDACAKRSATQHYQERLVI